MSKTKKEFMRFLEERNSKRRDFMLSDLRQVSGINLSIVTVEREKEEKP